MEAIITTINEEFENLEKARKKGAKDIKKRKRRGFGIEDREARTGKPILRMSPNVVVRPATGGGHEVHVSGKRVSSHFSKEEAISAAKKHLEKSQVKPFVRTRRGHLERVKGHTRIARKIATMKSKMKELDKEINDVAKRSNDYYKDSEKWENKAFRASEKSKKAKTDSERQVWRKREKKFSEKAWDAEQTADKLDRKLGNLEIRWNDLDDKLAQYAPKVWVKKWGG